MKQILKKQLRRAVVRYVLQSELVANTFPFRQPPVLLLSYPRSGSSWIGSVLDTSPEIAFLREPVNQPFLRRSSGTLINPHRDRQTHRFYTQLADWAFRGIPPDDQESITNMRDFSPIGRWRRRLLIKEVNPRASDFFVRRFRPWIVLIRRHPAALAESFRRMGWLTQQWEEFGYEYGRAMLRAREAIKNVRSLELRYEDVALNPAEEFSRIFMFLDIARPSNFGEVIQRYCEGGESDNPYATKRVSEEQVYKWKRNLNDNQIAAVMGGFRRSGLEE